VLVISQDSKRALQRWFGVPDEKITVTYLAAAQAYRPIERAELLEPLAALGLASKGYVLTVGTLEPRKNLSTLFAAFAGLPKTLRQRFPLVVVGMKGWKYDELLGEARALVDAGELRFLGYLEDSQMPVLYAGAAAFCYPSRYEGFGLPALEAMAAGVPVLTSNATSLPEVVGAAGLMVDPDDVGGMRDSLELLLENADLASRMAGLGLERAASFSWERCALETVNVYQRVAKARGLRDGLELGKGGYGHTGSHTHNPIGGQSAALADVFRGRTR
jgi:alpha-1,3-rhamnosyl/mannosyltransferase